MAVTTIHRCLHAILYGANLASLPVGLHGIHWNKLHMSLKLRKKPKRPDRNYMMADTALHEDPSAYIDAAHWDDEEPSWRTCRNTSIRVSFHPTYRIHFTERMRRPITVGLNPSIYRHGVRVSVGAAPLVPVL